MFAMLVFLSIFLAVNPITFIADRNYYVNEGEKAYKKQQYTLASQHYSHIISDLEWSQDNIRLNLAHSYFLAKKYEFAATHYALTSQSKDVILASVALNQLGYLASINQDFEKALQYFQEAIIHYNQNHEARYNYELIAKILQKRGKKYKKSPQKQSKEQSQKQEKSIQNAQENASTEPKLNPQKLKDLQLNREKAEAILKTIRNQESQHIQQQQQKKKLSNQTNSNLPDW